MKTRTFHIQFRTACLILLFLQVSIYNGFSQQNNRPLSFHNGAFTGKKNITAASLLSKDSIPATIYKDKYYVLLQFDRIPTPQERKDLETQGLHLYDYIPGRAFLAEMPGQLPIGQLSSYGISGLYHLPTRLKIDTRLTTDPSAYAQGRDLAIAASYFGSLSRADITKALEEAGATLVTTRVQLSNALFIRASPRALRHIATLPFISALTPASIKSYPLNYNNRAAHGLDALNNSPLENLQGDGIVVGVGDDSDPYTHVDFTGRQIDRFAPAIGTHGTHVSGTIAGGGIIDPKNKGMAPHATLLNQYFDDILTNSPTWFSSYKMQLTNNSYAQYDHGCATDGDYDVYSHNLDDLMTRNPAILNVFAAGNDGYPACTPFAFPFGTIKSGYQCSKDALMVGAIDNSNYLITYFSSSGPVADGRLKPEIVAGGNNILSTFPYNTYGYESGTSMASPTVTGALALLLQRFRQLNGANPSAALLKALVCNTATDIGNPGPDFIYGFGTLNAPAALEAIEKDHYFTGTLANGGANTFTITGVPAGAKQVKVMLYWSDPPAMPYAPSTLVNNLDLTVTSSDATLHHPMILNPDPAHTNDVAVEGVDNINNIEQVVINNPPAGNCTIQVKGADIPSGSQDYVVVYQLVQPAITLSYPFGKETWVPGESEVIRWNATDGDTNPFTLSYSPDNGSTWTTITNTAPAASRMFTWTVPGAATSQALIRVSRNGAGYSDSSHYNFVILGQPVVTATNPCQGYISLIWPTIPSAASYDIMQLKGDTMVKITSTTDTSLLLSGLPRDSSYWLAVRAVYAGVPGRRSLAVNIMPTGGACTLSAMNNDFSVDSLISPLSGRAHTSSQLGSATPIRIELRNLGAIASATPIGLSYRVNGGPVINESISAVLTGHAAYNYTFTNTYDFSAPGAYTLQIWVSYPGDPLSANDTLTTVIRQLQNDPITLDPSFTEGFESAANITYTSPVKGFIGLDRCDFSRSDANGRARTFLDTGFAHTGQRSAILDQIHYGVNTTTDSLITTFNLSGYSATDEIWLNFYYRNQGIDSLFAGNQVWIRGNDQSPWLPVYTLDYNPDNIGIYQPSPNIDISGTLKAGSQTPGSSFQIKFGEQGHTSANSLIPNQDVDDGYSFDDITLSRAVNDLGVLSLTAPNLNGICSLSSTETITLLVKNNNTATATNIPVTWSINGVNITETIPSINAKDSIQYSFTHKADLSAYKDYTLNAWIAYPGDTYSFNDTLPPIHFKTTPLINTFPYLEGFESGDGNWYTGGLNSSWQWGHPAKTIIDKAANGNNCWVTSLTGNYNDLETSYLYSPCFDLSSLTSPVLSFSHIFRTEDDCACDYHWIEYSTDGNTWVRLGLTGSGTNWYDNPARQAWQLSDTSWHVSSIDIPTHATHVRFRFVMSSDNGTNYEGVAIDDIHIFDKAAIYNGPDLTSGLTRSVSGSSWVDFDVNGHRIVSINPNGQNLGTTSVKVFIRQGPVRNDGRQYYLNRNLVIQPAQPPAAPVQVRYYFLDTEADSLVHASTCPSCTTIADPYQSGITQYSSSLATEEDNDLGNNIFGVYQFHQAHKDVSIIPYDSGYYAEYTVTGFSEFWIDNGGPAADQPLALSPITFTAVKAGDGALLQWIVPGTKNIARYITEKSYDSVHFTSFDSLQALGGDTLTTYQLMDTHLYQGVNFYRLKIIDTAGNNTYTPIRTVYAANGQPVIDIYPNPTIGKTLYISSSLPCRNIRLIDVSGREILRTSGNANFYTLSLRPVSKGIYFIVVDTDAGRTVEKIFVR